MNATAEAAATERAIAEDPESSAFWIDAVRCRVYGRTGNLYAVTLIGNPDDTAGYTCTCKAGEHGRLCWHVAAAKIRRPAYRLPARPARPANCPECGERIDSRGECSEAYLFGGCDYRPARK